MKTFHKEWMKALLLLVAVALVLAACGGGSDLNGDSDGGGGMTENGADSGDASPDTDAGGSAEDGATETSGEHVTIEFWHAYGEGEDKVLQEQVLPRFHETHANIKVNATRMPTENLEQQVITAAAGGTPPDLMRMDIVWVPRFASLGALQPVDDMPGFDQIAAQSFEAPLSSNLFNGKHYGIPLDTNTKVAIYNKALLEEAGASEPPETMDELVELARVMKENGKYGITIGGVDTWNFSGWFWTLGGRYTNGDYTQAGGFLNSEDSVKALETIVSWHEEGLLAPPILAGQPGTWEGLRGEGDNPPQYMMIEDGPWFFGILGDAVKDTTIPAMLPAGPDGTSHSIVGGQDLVIFEGAQHPEAAWTFAKFMHSAEIQELMAVETGLIPANREAANPTSWTTFTTSMSMFASWKRLFRVHRATSGTKLANSCRWRLNGQFAERANRGKRLDAAAGTVDEILQEAQRDIAEMK